MLTPDLPAEEFGHFRSHALASSSAKISPRVATIHAHDIVLRAATCQHLLTIAR